MKKILHGLNPWMIQEPKLHTMLRHASTRLILLVPVLLGISLIVFLIWSSPGDPAIAILQGYATAENVAKLRAVGLTDPFWNSTSTAVIF